MYIIYSFFFIFLRSFSYSAYRCLWIISLVIRLERLLSSSIQYFFIWDLCLFFAVWASNRFSFDLYRLLILVNFKYLKKNSIKRENLRMKFIDWSKLRGISFGFAELDGQMDYFQFTLDSYWLVCNWFDWVGHHDGDQLVSFETIDTNWFHEWFKE